MTKYYSVNKQYATGDGASCIYDLVNTLVSASWTIQSSSNGTNFGAGTTYWTATSLANSNAWVTVREPTGPGGREWCFQRTTNNYTWRVKVSPYASFTGSATATRVPTATDEGLIWGSGTDASPTGAQVFGNSVNKFHIVAESTPVGPVGNQAYGFWAFSNLNSSYARAGLYTFFCQEPLAVGSYPELTGSRVVTTSGDADPCIYGCYFDANGNSFDYYLQGVNDTTNIGTTTKYFHKYQNASGSFVNGFDATSTINTSANSVFQKYFAVHPCTGQDVAMPFQIGRFAQNSSFFTPTINNGYKGICNFLRLSTANRSAGTTMNLSTNAYIYLTNLLMPWPENIVPQL